MELGKTLRTLFAAAALAASAGCDHDPDARVRLAEFQDENPDGQAQQDESILVYLDRKLPAGFNPNVIKVSIDPPTRSTLRANIEQNRELLRVTIVDGTPQLQLRGVHIPGMDSGPSGLLIDLGDGILQAIDLQKRVVIPHLERAIWIDASPQGGNAVVDRGDRIRLVFDQKVKLADKLADYTPRVPQDLVLSKDQDRLGSEEVPAELVPAESGNEHELDIILGFNPILEIAGSIAADGSRVNRTGPHAPSGLAVNGTRLLPMKRIEALNGGPGVYSEKEVDIELPESKVPTTADTGDSFGGAGSRMYHTLTRFQDRFAVIAGGLTVAGKEPIDEVLLYNPRRTDPSLPAFELIGKLPRPSWQHTATLLPGADRQEGTEDDLVVFCGGTDGKEVFSDIIVVFLSSNSGSLELRRLPVSLKVPRAEHAAAAVGSQSLLVDGGRTLPDENGSERFTGSAELIRFEREGDELRVAEDRLFRSLARARHTLDLLVPDKKGRTWVLSYGGYGRNRYIDPWVPILKTPDRPLDPFGEKLTGKEVETLFDPRRGSILSSPILINLENPRDSITSLAPRPEYALVRTGHLSAGLGGLNSEGVPAADSVILLSGSLLHPIHGLDGDIAASWELPSQNPLERITSPRRAPDGHEALSGILFTFDPADPQRSTIDTVRHPAPEPSRLVTRENADLCRIPGLGVLLSGGEPPSSTTEPELHSSLEIYLAEETGGGQLKKIASLLPSARSRHRSYLVQEEGKCRLLLIGGSSSTKADIEELILPTPAPR